MRARNGRCTRGILPVLALLGVLAAGCGDDGGKTYDNRITIETVPEGGATVLIDGVPYGKTPVTVTGLAPGSALVEVSMERYKRAMATYQIPESGEATFRLAMAPLVGKLSILSNPPQAEVYLDGENFLGQTPLNEVEVPVGTHTYELRKERFFPLTGEIEIRADYKYTKVHELQPKPARIEVFSSPTGAQLWLNFRIQKEKTPTRLTVPPGTYTVTVYTPGYIMAEEVVTVEAGDEASVTLRMKEGNVPPGMVLIPEGEFIMGVDDRSPDERPQRKVFVKAFYIDKFEVTNFAYKLVFPEHTFPERKEMHPVTGISWEQATLYAKKVGKRLPTEIEWEKAARGTDGREYPWGNLWDPALANAGGRLGAGTEEIGQYRAGASPYGVMDMAGNVFEWTESWYNAYPGNTVIEKEYGQVYRVLRGGSYRSSSFDVRCARRHYDLQTNARADYGFRCALDVGAEEQAKR